MNDKRSQATLLLIITLILGIVFCYLQFLGFSQLKDITGYYPAGEGSSVTTSFIYLIVGLIINTILFLSVYLDVEVYKNTTHWILWDVYSLGVNIVDFTMIIALIVDRDFLFLNKLKNFVFASAKTHKLA